MNALAGLLSRYAVRAEPLRTQRRIELAALLLAAVLGLLAAAGVLRLALSAEPAALPPSPESLQVRAVARSGEVSPESRAEIRDRPLFWAGRRVQGADKDTAPPIVAEAKDAEKAGDIKVVGVFDGGKSAGIIAVIRGQQRRLLLGEEVDGWKLVAINQNTVVLQSGKRKRSLTLVRGTGAK